ncbi:hypothetical protein BC940DRAFT_337072 [Gongronella butleri]|nr:hypothetical protein BC940DRAFT_337072 [Gongronella butleri]
MKLRRYKVKTDIEAADIAAFYCFDEYAAHFKAVHIKVMMDEAERNQTVPSKRPLPMEDDAVSAATLLEELKECHHEIGQLRTEIRLLKSQLITNDMFQALPSDTQHEILGAVLTRET